MPLLPLFSFRSPVRMGAEFVSHRSRRNLTAAAVLCLLALLASAPAYAVTHAKLHRTRHPVLNSSVPWHFSRYTPRMFPGSHDMLVTENEELNRLQSLASPMRESSYDTRWSKCWCR